MEDEVPSGQLVALRLGHAFPRQYYWPPAGFVLLPSRNTKREREFIALLRHPFHLYRSFQPTLHTFLPPSIYIPSRG